MEVKPISFKDVRPFLTGLHYAKRVPSVSYSFGLFTNGILEGVVTYGKPPSAPLRKGICGKEHQDLVIELNRLCLIRNLKNHASFLVSKSLKMLPKPSVIVSFADTQQGHVGIVYQACNFLYCGLSAKRTDWKIKGKEHLHGQTVADEFRGFPNRSELMREKYGGDFYLQPRSRKHRYVYIVGTKGERAQLKKKLAYKIQEYPK